MGINTFDTSNNYSNGESERMLAKFIEKVSLGSKEKTMNLTYH